MLLHLVWLWLCPTASAHPQAQASVSLYVSVSVSVAAPCVAVSVDASVLCLVWVWNLIWKVCVVISWCWRALSSICYPPLGFAFLILFASRWRDIAQHPREGEGGRDTAPASRLPSCIWRRFSKFKLHLIRNSFDCGFPVALASRLCQIRWGKPSRKAGVDVASYQLPVANFPQCCKTLNFKIRSGTFSLTKSLRGETNFKTKLNFNFRDIIPNGW